MRLDSPIPSMTTRCDWQIMLVSGILFGIPFVGTRMLGMSLKAATNPAMLAIIPGFFGLKALCRYQEARADEDAAKACHVLSRS